MKLIKNEEVISKDNGIILTNCRVRHSVVGGGDASFTSIILENIQSISLRYKSNPLLLLIGILIAALSVLASRGEGGIIVMGLIIGGALAAYYYITRKHYLTIASAGGSIDILIKGQNTQKLVEYIDLVEETIVNRKMEMAAANI